MLVQWERGRSFRDVEIRIGATSADSIIVLLRDITERKRAELQTEALNRVLQRSRDLMRTLLDALQDGLLLLDAQGRVLALNHRFAELLEDRTTDVVGLHWMEFSETTQFLPFSWEQAQTALREGQPQHRRERYTLPDSAVRILDITLFPIANGEDAAEQLIVHIADVSERLQLEAQVLEQERFAASARLAATVAHEVNSPLQAVESCLHIAERANEKRRAEYLQIAREEVIRVGQILRQLLEVFQPALPRRVPVDINALIERVILLMGSTLARQGVAVEVDGLRSLPLVWCHGDEITQVLINLVMNAAQAMPRGGMLELRTRFRPAPDEVTIDISDTGQGMTKELQARIFEPFFTTKSDGNGMGLAVCQKIVQRHQGSLTVHSVLDAGTTFTIRLPVSDNIDL
jgi:PAS domain S-box-containing protein